MQTSKKHILFLINNLSRGGAEGVFANEAKALNDLGYQTEIYLLYPDNFKNLYDIKAYIKLISKIKRDKINIVYSTLDDANFVAKIVRIFVSFKLFCREANMTEEKLLKFKIADVFLNFLTYKLVMVAGAVKDSYASYDPWHKQKMVVLYNGADLPKQPPIKNELLDYIKIIGVASFTPKKGLADLIEIFGDYVINKNKNFSLEILGDGILYTEINNLVKTRGLEAYIKCPGALAKKDLYNKYLESDIFVLTSKREGCPNALLKTMAYGLAPVCFSVGAVPEIIENGISGIVIQKGDKKAFGEALNDLLVNPWKIKEMGKRARERITEKFSFDIHIKNLLNILELIEK